RSSRMTTLVKQISTKKYNEWIGWEGEILVDEIGKGALIGRNFAYKPCVVKEDELNGKKEEFLGKSLRVRVVDSTASTLRTILIPENGPGG
ncbi:MAG: hypothetical protein ACREBQ_09665, partial [Nitrososphaerales archaeon]